MMHYVCLLLLTYGLLFITSYVLSIIHMFIYALLVIYHVSHIGCYLLFDIRYLPFINLVFVTRVTLLCLIVLLCCFVVLMRYWFVDVLLCCFSALPFTTWYSVLVTCDVLRATCCIVYGMFIPGRFVVVLHVLRTWRTPPSRMLFTSGLHATHALHSTRSWGMATKSLQTRR